MYPIAELQEWLARCKAFHKKRQAAVSTADDEGDNRDNEFNETGGSTVDTETANNDPTPDALTEPIADWWPSQWVRMSKDTGRGTANTIEEWLIDASSACGQSHQSVTKVASEVQALRDWLNSTPQEDALRFSLCRLGVPQFYIAGSWHSWNPVVLEWDGFHYTHNLTVGEDGWESFQILLNNNWANTIHPSVPDAHPLMSYELEGPDNKGHGLNWTIGCPPGKTEQNEKNSAKPGEHFQIVIKLDDQKKPYRVTWHHFS